MVRWRLTGAEGFLAGAPLEEIRDSGGVLAGAPRECPSLDGNTEESAWLTQQIRSHCGGKRPTWLILPDRARPDRAHWQDVAAGNIELGFGRAGVTLAMSQISRLKVPASLVAVDRLPGTTPDTIVESRLCLAMEPGETGLGLILCLVDGRLDGDTDMAALLRKGHEEVPEPSVLCMPGSGSDGSLDRLMPSLSAMGNWVQRDVRWEFAEARIGPLGVVGSVYNWYWLHEGYRLGEWQTPAVILDMDSSPLVGLTVVDFTA